VTDNAQKTPTAQYLSQFAQKVVQRFLQQLGLSLPGQVATVAGSIVTAKFNVTSQQNLPTRKMPMAGPEWIRYPTQVGDLGVAVAVSASLGPASGLGSGMPNLNQKQGNLANLFWMPISSANWSQTDDPNAVVMYGPNGVVLRTKDGTAKIIVSKTGIEITSPPGLPVTVSGNLALNGNLLLNGNIESATGGVYGGTLQVAGDIIAGYGTADNVNLRTHTHDYVRPTSGTTEPAPTASPNAGT
jgi:hypothetical protein